MAKKPSKETFIKNCVKENYLDLYSSHQDYKKGAKELCEKFYASLEVLDRAVDKWSQLGAADTSACESMSGLFFSILHYRQWRPDAD